MSSVDGAVENFDLQRQVSWVSWIDDLSSALRCLRGTAVRSTVQLLRLFLRSELNNTAEAELFLPTHRAVRWAVSFCLSFALGHELTALRFPIPSRVGAVIDAGICVNPHLHCWVSGVLGGDCRVAVYDSLGR